mmetsp:Transcript_105281/g.177944  ORF Transcript_105281/g.177944 Transcript_105281/m.177944 type:complete len:94 (+) Transcript_105281:174-455(+)
MPRQPISLGLLCCLEKDLGVFAVLCTNSSSPNWWEIHHKAFFGDTTCTLVHQIASLSECDCVKHVFVCVCVSLTKCVCVFVSVLCVVCPFLLF